MSLGRLEYEKRVNRVIDHIREHLADELKLADLARVAAFSPFHFHRLFTAIVGETLFAFIQRVRIERAAVALRDHRDESVLAVALDHGFCSAAAFARAFRALRHERDRVEGGRRRAVEREAGGDGPQQAR